MKTLIGPKQILLSMLAAGIVLSAPAQIATIDVSNPTNPIVTYDANPFINAPDLPDDPTRIYMDALVIPPASAVTGADTFALEYAALKDAGAFEGLVALEFGPYEAMAPVVITNDT